MIISRDHTLRGHLIIRNKRIEQLQRIRYFGTTINEDWDRSLEIKRKIEKN